MSIFGPSKRVVNRYIRTLTNSNALVLDTNALGSARSLAHVLSKKNITVFGIDKNIERNCRKFGVLCEKGWSGDVLKKLKKKRFGLIYLDYCGTPDGSESFRPFEDMARASFMLKKDGVLAVTFCKRCSSVLSKCINMCPPGLFVQRAYEYCDTSPMIFVAYSARKLHRLGPPVGSIVKIKNMIGRVEEVYLNGIRLKAVVKKKGKYILKKKQGRWEEPFSAIDKII